MYKISSMSMKIYYRTSSYKNEDYVMLAMSRVLKFIVFCIFLNLSCFSGEKITLKNHEKINQGEWLIKFYADWCSACQHFAHIWDHLSVMDYQDSGIRFGEVNIEKEPHLSVKYSVRYLPTIYHIKDGVVRLYEGKKEVNEIEEFISSKKYLQVKPLSWYNDPNGVVIYLLLKFVNAYEYFLELQQNLVENHGYNEKVAAAIAYALASLILIMISFVGALSLIPILNYFLPKQPSDFDASSIKKSPRKLSKVPTTDDDDTEDSDELEALSSSSTKNTKNTKKAQGVNDLRERKRNQQKKRASRE